MKYMHFSCVLLTAALLNTSAFAQQIRPFQPLKPFEINPLSPGGKPTLYKQIGPMTFGSDGSRGYTIGGEESSGSNTNQSMSTPVYLTSPTGKLVLCKKYGENVFCD